MRSFLDIPNLSGRVGQKIFQQKISSESFGNWTAVFEFWGVNGAGLIFLNISHLHFQLREQLL